MCASSEGSGDTKKMPRLILGFTAYADPGIFVGGGGGGGGGGGSRSI